MKQSPYTHPCKELSNNIINATRDCMVLENLKFLKKFPHISNIFLKVFAIIFQTNKLLITQEIIKKITSILPIYLTSLYFKVI